MSKIDKKIAEAASFYGNAHIKNVLKLDRDATFNEKCIPKFDTYDLETAFEQGADFALSHQWVSVEEALPNHNHLVIVLCDSDEPELRYTTAAYIDGIWRYPDEWYYDIPVLMWMPIPPLPEASKKVGDFGKEVNFPTRAQTAAMAMQGLLANALWVESKKELTRQEHGDDTDRCAEALKRELAEDAVELADALLAELRKEET